MSSEPTFLDRVVPFLVGGLSGMTATSVIQPIDTVKVRIQIKGEQMGAGADANPIRCAKEVFAEGGVKGFYKGLDSALFRQATYATARLGIFRSVSDYLQKKNDRNLYPIEKILSSLFAGFCGALIGNPADLTLVRFQSDSTLPPEARRNYKNVFDAMFRIAKEEGILTLWRGSVPTIARAMAMNLGQLFPYDEIKERLNKSTGTKDTLQTRLIASAVAGFSAAFCSLPFDNIKTKLQKMAKNPDGTDPYSGFFDCMRKSVQKGGIKGLWIGFFPTFYVRVAPHAMITLLTQDFLHHQYKSYKNKNH